MDVTLYIGNNIILWLILVILKNKNPVVLHIQNRI